MFLLIFSDLRLFQDTMNKTYKCAINLTLLKFIGIYQFVDPKSLKVLGFNIFQLIHIILIIISTTVVIVGLTGFFFNINNSIDNSFDENMQLIFYITCLIVGNFKLIIIINYADKIWNLFYIINESFLRSNYCKKNFYKLINCGKSFRRLFFWYLFVFYMTSILWATRPIIINNRNSSQDLLTNNTLHLLKLSNLKYPITEEMYNRNYMKIYLMESIISVYSAYALVAFDLFLFAILRIISTQYELVTSAYKNLEHRAQNKSELKFYNNLINKF